jgi:hypothetical protein
LGGWDRHEFSGVHVLRLTSARWRFASRLTVMRTL